MISYLHCPRAEHSSGKKSVGQPAPETQLESVDQGAVLQELLQNLCSPFATPASKELNAEPEHYLETDEKCRSSQETRAPGHLDQKDTWH